MTDKITVDRELLQKIVESLDSRCGTNAPERTEIIPVLIELLGAPVQECGYDETTGSCTRNPCCAVAPVQEPEISDAQASLLASALAECILASGIVGKDKDGFSGPELLMFAEDLKQMLERSLQPAQEPVAVNQIRLGYGCWSDISDVELKIFVAKDGWELRTLYAAPQPRKAVKLTLEDIKRVQDSDLAFETNSCAAFAEAIQGAFIAKNGLES